MMGKLGCVLALFVLVFFAFRAHAATITVNSTDLDDETSADGNCTLSEAIDNANNDADGTGGDCAAGSGADTIEFNVGGGGAQTLVADAAINSFASEIIIDGTTQGTATCGTLADLSDRSLLIEIDFGQSAGFGFLAGSDNTTIRGLVMSNSNGSSIDLGGGVSGITIECNHFGTNAAGTALSSLGRTALSHIGEGAGNTLTNIMIGGTDAWDGNVISGSECAGIQLNSQPLSTLTVQNNFIGTDITGTVGIGNYEEGISLIPDHITGSSNVSVLDNVVGDNGFVSRAGGTTNCGQTTVGHGIEVGAEEAYVGPGFSPAQPVATVTIDGNRVGIGTDDSDLANAGAGISVQNSTTVDIQDNIASNNGAEGITALVDIVTIDVSGNTVQGNSEQGIAIEDATGVTIGSALVADRNIVGGNGYAGIYLGDSDTATIYGNYIGVDADGVTARSNGSEASALPQHTGIMLSNVDDVDVGGSGAGEENVVAGNNHARVIAGIMVVPDIAGATYVASDSVRIQGNHIGVAADGTTSVPNTGAGVLVMGSTNVLVGGSAADEGNIIQGHIASGGVGVMHAPAFPTAVDNVSILRNSIYGNSQKGIDLLTDADSNYVPDTSAGPTPNDVGDGDAGPNDYLNYPVIYNAEYDGGAGETTAYYYLDVPAGNYRIEFFENATFASTTGHGEGETFLSTENITHTGSGVETFSHTLSSTTSGDYIAATATLIDGTAAFGFGPTSEFSNAIVVDTRHADFGDAPDSAIGTGSGNYRTTAVDNGAYHFVHASSTVYLGACVDANDYITGTVDANDDDTDTDDPVVGTCATAGDDDDGVSFSEDFQWGETTDVEVTASAAGELYVWVDTNRNGSFADSGELLYDGSLDANDLSVGANTISLTMPSSSMGSVNTYARFRFNSQDVHGGEDDFDLGPTGEALDGEVEDYLVTINAEDTGSSSSGSSVRSSNNPFNPPPTLPPEEPDDAVCSDPEATNYNPTGTHTQSLCEYYFDLTIAPAGQDPVLPQNPATAVPGASSDPSNTNPIGAGNTQSSTPPSGSVPSPVPGVELATLIPALQQSATIDVAEIECPYFETYLDEGNQGYEVAKMQDFLNKYLELDLRVDGDFGPATKHAVGLFQQAHRAEILDPWGLDESTGWFYKTSLGQANEIVGCEQASIFLERVNTTHTFDNTNLFQSYSGSLLPSL